MISDTFDAWEEEELQHDVSASASAVLIDKSDLILSACGHSITRNMSKTASQHVLLFWERSPPLAILAAAEIAQVNIEVKADSDFNRDSLPILLLQPSRYIVSRRT